ncbi:MAG: methylated-DNA--[protein]-cysteine S-methyltransferase [Candidatus Methanoperedens sp.]|nr:MAG: methylated-DNA--[protein]-cysteine S-methyltransferase [Candidatus Methanoperedens sp.]
MTDTDIIFSPALDCYLELIYNSGLSSIRFIRCKDKMIHKRTFNTTVELEEYFRGERTEFSCEVDLSNLSDFVRRVLEETRKIKYGTVVTYSDLSRRIGSNAVRAVGGALGRNPVPIIIPCHRVVAKNGIGGYSCGVDMKIKLLELERKHLSNNL